MLSTRMAGLAAIAMGAMTTTALAQEAPTALERLSTPIEPTLEITAPALLGAKLMAAGCGVVLYLTGVHRILAGLTAFYGVAAIGPWLAIFAGR